MPTIAAYGQGALCAVVRDDAGTTEVRVEVPLDLTGRIATVARSAEGGSYADYVLVPSGRGAIVAAGTTLSLVTDQGVRYDAARPDVLPMLGLRRPGAAAAALVARRPAAPGPRSRPADRVGAAGPRLSRNAAVIHRRRLRAGTSRRGTLPSPRQAHHHQCSA